MLPRAPPPATTGPRVCAFLFYSFPSVRGIVLDFSRGPRSRRYTPSSMSSLWPTLIGVFLGFAFGVGCALAVMYSIYMGGYRAAVRDAQLPTPPPRYLEAVRKLHR